MGCPSHVVSSYSFSLLPGLPIWTIHIAGNLSSAERVETIPSHFFFFFITILSYFQIRIIPRTRDSRMIFTNLERSKKPPLHPQTNQFFCDIHFLWIPTTFPHWAINLPFHHLHIHPFEPQSFTYFNRAQRDSRFHFFFQAAWMAWRSLSFLSFTHCSARVRGGVCQKEVRRKGIVCFSSMDRMKVSWNYLCRSTETDERARKSSIRTGSMFSRLANPSPIPPPSSPPLRSPYFPFRLLLFPWFQIAFLYQTPNPHHVFAPSLPPNKLNLSSPSTSHYLSSVKRWYKA